MNSELDENILDFFAPLKKVLLQYASRDDIDLAYKAFLYAAINHDGQKRASGEPYITHPVAVAVFLAEWRMDIHSVLAALLHDVIEDTPTTKDDIAAEFGEVVANLVDGVSKLAKVSFDSRLEAQAENFRKMLLALAKDLRVILVKLADRTHNMRTIGSLSMERRRRIARETLDIFAPIANRIGMYGVAMELEELGFEALYPDRYRVIKSLVNKVHGQHVNILYEIKTRIKQELKEVGVSFISIESRAKNVYSIYCKMKSNGLSFSEITDVYAIRVISNSVDCCYRSLGVVHGLYKPVPGKFKDYVALPKANGYQSLHTVLFGPYGVPIEVQLRTVQMDESASNGVASHWQYKSSNELNNSGLKQAREWVQRLVDIQRRTFDSLEFLENVKIDLFPDEIYVFSPKGRIFALPAGATALDFAYAVHTDIGNSCVSIKVNRQMATLSTVLSSGHTVEVVTSENAQPIESWLNFVRTAKAKSNIRHFIQQNQAGQAISLGEKLLRCALLDLGFDLDLLDSNKFFSSAGIDSVDSLFEEIGLGRRSAKIVAHQLVKDNKAIDISCRGGVDSSEPLVIAGTEGLVVQFAACCYPVPGDPVIGSLVSDEGIEVHHASCEPLINSSVNESFQQVPIAWDKSVVGEYVVEICIELQNERGVLAMLALSVSDADSGISDIKILKSDGCFVNIILEIYVRDRAHLANVLRKIKRLSRVVKVYRGGKLLKSKRSL